MPVRQYITIRETDFGSGIDQQSAENRIPEGFCEDLENADPKPTGHLAKRAGFQGFAGNLPLRVQSMSYTDDSTDNIILTFDDSIEIPTGRSQPVILLGKTSSDNAANVGDFPNSATSIHYYSGFTADIRKPIPIGVFATSIPQTEHDFNTKYLFVGVAESTNQVNYSNSQMFLDSLSINGTSFDITATTNNLSGSALEAFFFIKDKSAVASEVYISAGNVVPSGGTTAISVPAGTHALGGGNIIVKAFQVTGGAQVEISPSYVYLDDVTADVTVGVTNTSGSSITVDLILSLAPTANFLTGAVAAGSTSSVVIDTTVTGGSNFAFVACYLESTPSTTLQQVIPDSIVADAVNGTITITFTNNMSSGATFEIYWEFASISTNTITLTGSTISTANQFTDDQPQLTLYGLDHAEIYGEKTGREGWTNHIDSYRSSGDSRLIAGIGGNLFAARLRSEGQNSTAYLLPLLYPAINGRLSADTIIGPAFYDTGETPARTRGFITGDDGGDNFFKITSVAYNTGTTYTDYTMTVPNMVISGTLSTIISTTAGLEDYFTVQQCSYSVLNGIFKIKAVANPAAGILVVSVENPNISTVDYDETDLAGDGGIFTDRFTFSASSPFLADDILNSDLFSDTTQLTIVNTVGTSSVIKGATEVLSLPGGLRIAATRSSYIVPMRNFGGTADVTNIVRGDMLTYTEISRQLRVLSVNPLSNINLTIVGDGTDATVTMASSDTTSLFVGKRILITGSTNYNGVQTITNILDADTFTFATELSTTEAGVMVGKTVEIDEALTYSDSPNSLNYFTVHGRWIPVEIPEDSFTGTPKTVVSHFNSLAFDNQAILRSTMVSDNLYLTNSSDEVLKFDGTNIYRAGLPRWPLQLFLTTDTTATGKIVVNNPSIVTTAASNSNIFHVSLVNELVFSVGDYIKHSLDGITYLIKDIRRDSASPATEVHISVDKIITNTTSGGTLTRTSSYKYYMRLNAVDANNNIIASAVTGAEDNTIEIGADAAVYLRGIGFPAWDIYDYDRLEAQIYRTKANGNIFYRLTTLPLSFDTNKGYFDYTDTDSDVDLKDLDEVTTALKGAELGTAWTEPVRAKHITSAGNKLILGNLKDYPQLDLQILKKTTTLTQSVFTNSSNRTWLFRKDNTDTGTTTNNTTRIAYQFTDVSTAKIISAITLPTSTSFRVQTSTNHGLTVGDWVYLFRSAVTDAQQLTFAGWWQVSQIDSVTQFRVNYGDAPASVTGVHVDRVLIAATPQNVPVPVGTDGNYSQFNGNRTATEPYEFLAMRRLSDAINCSMRKCETTGFSPWMISGAGNEFNTGQLIVRQPKVFNTSLELVIPALTGVFEVYVNGVKRSGAAQAGTIERLFPSRIIASYNNYPEIFDAPTATLDTESDSAVDINPADGQELTANIPFFGDAAFGAAQKSGIVVGFKTNSIYLVDLSAKDSGTNAVQKLETRGKGCTAPYSVSVTKSGIMFANNTGIYRLNKNLDVDFIGRRYGRIFDQTVDKTQIDILTGHHDTQSNSYKLSYPVIDETENSRVAVYNHTREYEGRGDGSWTRYTSHPATGWANLTADSYFASTAGRVFIIRRLGEVSDFRDDNQAVNMTVLLRAIDAGDSARRKVFSHAVTHFRVPADSSGTILETSIDLSTTFLATDSFQLVATQSDGLGGSETKKVLPIDHSISAKMGTYIQFRYTNSSIDEPVEITGIDIRVAGMSDKGLKQAASTENV